jgi:hypothetical protein
MMLTLYDIDIIDIDYAITIIFTLATLAADMCIIDTPLLRHY